MSTKTSLELINSLSGNNIKIFSYGAGYIYDCFNILHGHQIDGFIHSNPESIKTKFNHNIEIITPEQFVKRSYPNCIVLIYTESYRLQAEKFCIENSFDYLLYDDSAHLSQVRISKVAEALNFLNNSSLISNYNRKRFSDIFDTSSKTDFTENLTNNPPGHWQQYIDDICKALTKAVYWHQLNGGIGDIAEFGTASGVTSGFLASAMDRGEKEPYLLSTRPSKLHLFDSFQGLPEISNPLDVQAGWKKGWFAGLSELELFQRINRFLPKEQIKIYSGWFKDTMKTISIDTKFAIIHIDCDLYESTMDVLDYLFENEHLLDGCVIFFDDWNCGNASPHLGERRAWSEITKKYNVNYSDCGEYSCAGHKFIVHL